MSQQSITVRPDFARVENRAGMIIVQIKVGGSFYMNTNRGLGYDSVEAAQRVADATMARGAEIPTEIAYRMVG